MIIVEDVHKRYHGEHGPKKWILSGVNVTIPSRHSVALIGKNGAGKSTLLRIIGGIDFPTKGRVQRRCQVSWPMGGAGLEGTLTGRQNAKFVCRIHGHQDELADRLAYIQDFAELGAAFDEPVQTYSSGMRSRLQFAMSLAFNFEVYISDEVTAAGDARFRKKAAEAFKNIADQASVIMVSHDEITLRQFCRSAIWINNGQAHWFDDLEDGLRAYKDDQLA
jgi:capsular polysaccharide transport system ATP-binding protein